MWSSLLYHLLLYKRQLTGSPSRSIKTFLGSIALGVIIFLSSFSLHGQTLPPRITAIDPGTFQGHSQVFSGTVLPDGRMLFSTFEELIVFDGEDFRDIPVGSGKYVFSLDQAPDGRVFLGGTSTIGMLVPDRKGTLTFRSLRHLLPDSLQDFGTIWQTVCTDDGVYFRAGKMLLRFRNDTIKKAFPEKEPFAFIKILEGETILQSNKGLFQIGKDDDLEFLKGSKETLQEKGIYSLLPAVEDTGAWFLLNRDLGPYLYEPFKGNLSPFPEVTQKNRKVKWSEKDSYTACRLDPSKNPYGAAYAIGTIRKGVYLLSSEGRVILQIGKEDGLPSNKTWDLIPTKNGGLWVATNNGIAFLHTHIPFTIAREGEAFEGKSQNLLRFPSKERALLILCTSQGSWRWSDKKRRFSKIPGANASSRDILRVRSTKSEHKRTPYSVLYLNKAPTFTRLLVGDGSAPFWVDPLYKVGADPKLKRLQGPEEIRVLAPIPPSKEEEKSSKGFVAAGRSGIYVFKPDAFTNKDEPDPLLKMQDLSVNVFSLEVDHYEGRTDSLKIWAGLSSHGVLKMSIDTGLNDYRITRYDSTEGLPEGPVNVFNDPFDEKEVVFGTSKGLYQYKNERFTPSCRYGDLFCDGSRPVYRLEGREEKGEVWIIDTKGGQIKKVSISKDETLVDSTIFRTLDIGPIKTVLAEEESVWFGGTKGLASYHPGMEYQLGKDWNCFIRKVLGSKDSLLFGGNFWKEIPEKEQSDDTLRKRVTTSTQPRELVHELPYTKNRMRFHYAAPFPDRQDAVEYSYKLSGFDTAWSEWSDETKKEYTNIPEGDYTFKVKGRNIYLNESSTAEYRFTILPPWYRTWVAYGGYSLAGIGLIWLIVRLNSRRLVAQKQRLEKIVNERTREIQAEKAKVEEQQKETEKQKERVEEAHKEITKSIDYAQKIQFALLQAEEHVSPHLPEHFILFKPQSKVSGDFYWAREHKGYLYIAAVDCTGHGVPGAFMSMLGISQLNEIMSTNEVPTPGEILTELRDRVVRELSGSQSGETAKDGMDAAMLKIPISLPDQAGQEDIEVQFTGAQNPLYVSRKGIGDNPPSVEGREAKPFKRSSDGIEIKGDAMPVGYDESTGRDFSTITLHLQKGDLLYIFSDGYADQFGGEKGKKFRYGPFKQLLARIHEKPLEEQKQELDRNFEEWKGDQEQIDDVVVLGIRV